MTVMIGKVALLLRVFLSYEVDSIKFHHLIGNKMHREFYCCCASTLKDLRFIFSRMLTLYS